jgi:WD40 repeat protein
MAWSRVQLTGGDGRFVNSLAASLDNLHPGKPILAVAFSPDPDLKWLATGSADKTIRITDYESQAHVTTFDHHNAGVISIAFNPTQPYVLLSRATSRSTRSNRRKRKEWL